MNNLIDHTLYEQAILFIAALVVFTSFLMLAQKRLSSLVYVFAWQGLLLAATTGLAAYAQANPHLYISAAMSLALKGFLVPWILLRLIERFDMRREVESLLYPAYVRIEPKPVCHSNGDVRARFDLRYDEAYASLDMIRQLLERLREGGIRADWRVPEEGAEGLGLVEGWRGEILSYVRFDRDNRIGRYYPRDPSVFNWPALERLIHGNIVPDFPLCNKSVNGSYSGHDL